MTKQEDLVVHSNALSRARWSVESVWEPRLVALLASKIHSDDEDFKKYAIHISEVFHGREYGGVNYNEVEKTVDKVMSRVITIHDATGWNKYTVFSGCRFDKESNILHIGFHPDLKPHYLNLQNQFVKYSLTEFLLLPSIYSQRLYQFLKSWTDKPQTPEIPIEDLHELLDAPITARKNYAEFKRYMLDKAYKDIHKITQLRFEFEAIKTGRKVTAIKFIFAKKRALPIAEKKKRVATEKQSKKNNDYFVQCIDCYKTRGNRPCLGGHQTSTVCKYCVEVVQPMLP